MSTTARARFDPDSRAELEEQRDLLLRSLDDLERERADGELDEEDYRELRAGYTARAAAVLRALESGPAAVPPRRRRDPRRLVGVVVAVALLAGGAGTLVAVTAGTRRPGETITGDLPATGSDRLAEAVELARAGDVAGALRLYDEILADDPGDVRSLLDQGLLRLRAGQQAGSEELLAAGEASLRRALELDPGDPEALFYLALAQNLRDDDAGAISSLEEALANDPSPVLRGQVESALEAARAGDAPPSEPEPAP